LTLASFEMYALSARPLFRPERNGVISWTDGNACGIDGQSDDLPPGDCQEPCACVRGSDVGYCHVDSKAIQQERERGQGHPKQNAGECKNQHELYQRDTPAHAAG